MIDAVLRTASLMKRYGPDAGVLGVDLVVPRGGVYGLVGPNGAGKTTLLSLVSGLRRPDSGTVDLAVGRQRIAVVADVPEFEPWLRAREVVALAAHLVGADETPPALDRALDQVGLLGVAERKVGGLSRGMSQRLALATAAVGEPELVILDEPSSALDPAGRAAVLDLVSRWGQQATVLLSSHVLSDVQRVADTVGVLHRGRMLYQGPLQNLVDRHVRPQWAVRVRGATAAFAAELARQPWVAAATDEGGGLVRVSATSLHDGERGIPAVAAATGTAVMSMQPEEADLEAAFLALTGADGRRDDAGGFA